MHAHISYYSETSCIPYSSLSYSLTHFAIYYKIINPQWIRTFKNCPSPLSLRKYCCSWKHWFFHLKDLESVQWRLILLPELAFTILDMCALGWGSGGEQYGKIYNIVLKKIHYTMIQWRRSVSISLEGWTRWACLISFGFPPLPSLQGFSVTPTHSSLRSPGGENR